MNKKRFLTEAEISTFLKASRQGRNKERDYCLMLMMYRHGLRVSEAIDIRLEQLDLDGSRLFVQRIKNGFSTHQPIEGDEMRAIKAWMRDRSHHKMAGSDLLFLSEQGKFTRQAVNYLVRIAGEKAGLTSRVTPHMLRHSCGFALANKDAATRTIQDYLGHKNIQNTVLYTAANANRFKGLWR